MNYLKSFIFLIFFRYNYYIIFRAFSGEDNGMYLTIIFCFLANFTCFASEYLLIKYFEEKNNLNFKNEMNFCNINKCGKGM